MGGCIVNGTIEDSVLFRQESGGNNCIIRNSLILKGVYIGDNTYTDNCIVESDSTIQANSYYKGESGIRIVGRMESERYSFWKGSVMKITDVRVRRIAKVGKMKAVVSITLDSEFVVHDIKVIEGEKGLFVAMPSKKTADGEYRDIAHPINSEMRRMVEDTILQKYTESLESDAEDEEFQG